MKRSRPVLPSGEASPPPPPVSAPDPSAPPSGVGAGSQRPTSLVVDVQICSIGQPLPPVPRQPGTQRDAAASHTRPDVTPPQSASAVQPQRPSVRHWLPASSGRH